MPITAGLGSQGALKGHWGWGRRGLLVHWNRRGTAVDQAFVVGRAVFPDYLLGHAEEEAEVGRQVTEQKQRGESRIERGRQKACRDLLVTMGEYRGRCEYCGQARTTLCKRQNIRMLGLCSAS